MRRIPLFGAAALAALVGAALLVAEVARTLGSGSLGSTGMTVMWIGVGLLAIGAIGVTVAVARDGAGSYGG